MKRRLMIKSLLLCCINLSLSFIQPPPSEFWYDEVSWQSNRVNPYIGKRPDLPKSVAINCIKFHSPVGDKGHLTSGYGFRPSTQRMHRGVDISLPSNSPIFSVWDGKVRVVGNDPKGFGVFIVVRHHNGLETVYGHLNSTSVKKGDEVRAGEKVGLSGNTGRSTGPHLHFETRFLGGDFNPSLIIDFKDRTLRNPTFVWTKQLYPDYNKMPLETYRLKSEMTLEELCDEKDWDLETLCLLNGILPDMVLLKGRVIRIVH
ncbi:MAG: M23 family metallopeptidase [Porphyromonas sp.]|nr:M23 family metallopeptidase [Porphyromonas sp.]